MVEISWNRRSYEAGVLVIPLDAEAERWTADNAETLDGITIADRQLLAAQQQFEPAPVPATGEGEAVSSPLEHAMHESDVVVLYTRELPTVNRVTVRQIGDAARLSGKLLGAVVVTPAAQWDHPDAHHAMTAIREAVDNVVILRGDSLIRPFLHVLRGGTHDGAAPAATGARA